MKKIAAISAILCFSTAALSFSFNVFEFVLVPIPVIGVCLSLSLLFLSKLSPTKAALTTLGLHSIWVVAFCSYFVVLGNIDGTTKWARAMTPVLVIDVPWNIVVFHLFGIRSIFNVGLPFFVYSLLVPGILYSSIVFFVIRRYQKIR